ncbi:hypothetical protein AB0D54_24240 [Streptomyces xanthophaeus]|uniref:hypothetical protein n=1 Tax=Streptomyces xanthophaeus TaxID=67385 RepID=UPI00342BB1E0
MDAGNCGKGGADADPPHDHQSRCPVHRTRPRHPGEPLLDLQEYTLGTVCAAVPIRTGTEPECVALSLPAPDPGKLQQAARVLRNEAIAVLLALLVGGSNPAPPRQVGDPRVVFRR